MARPLISLHLLALLILCAIQLHPAAASSDDLLMLDRFHRWMGAHGRSYPSAAEKLHRLEVYRHNVEFIETTNKESWRLGYELGENEFTDLTTEEFEAQYTGGVLVPKEDAAAIADGNITTPAGDVNEGRRTLASIPENFDWRKHGVVTPARFQGKCESCWAFAAVATVESLNKIKGGDLLDLSEQELVDCDSTDMGCKGGWIDEALQWIQAKGGVMTEADYSYQAQKGQCKTTKRARRVGKITDVKRVRGESQMKLAVFQRPVGVGIDAQGAVFKNYKNGIYKGPCTTKQN